MMNLSNLETIRVNFNVSSSEQRYHPLHLLISVDSAKKLGVKIGEKTFVGSLRRADFGAEQFVIVRVGQHGEGGVPILHLSDDTFDDGREVTQQNSISVSCTKAFLQHYKILQGETYYLRNVSAYPVRKVIVGVRNKETLLWTKKIKFGAGLIVSVCQEKVLVRENDIFLAPYPSIFLDDPSFQTSFYFDMHVLECSPVCQGILTVNTEIVIILTDVVSTDNTQLLFSSDIPSRRRQSNLLELCRSNSCISDFTIPLSAVVKKNGENGSNGILHQAAQACSQIDSRSNIGRGIRTSSKVSLKKPHVFILRPSVLPKHSLWSTLLLSMESVHRFDTLYIIGMPRPLMAKHGLFDGALVHVSSLEYQTEEQASHLTDGGEVKGDNCGSDVDGAPTKPSSVSHRKRLNTGTRKGLRTLKKLAQVKMLMREYDSTKDVYVSPILMFNIHPTPSSLSSHTCSFEKISQQNSKSDGHESVSVSSSWNAKLRLAKEVQISLVNCPNYSPRSSFNEILKRHFQTPRTVAVGDVIAVRSGDDPEFSQSLSDDTETRHPVIYFKVIRIEPEIQDSPAFIVDYNSTTLIQVGSLHSHIPVRAETYLLPGEVMSYWERSRLNGLQTYTDELESIILPHLTSRACFSTEFRPAILLSGQHGCGKGSVVKAVVRKFGLHVTKVNCHSVCGETPASTEARLKKIFDSGVMFSPCILLLQHIHVLGKDRDGNVEDARVAKNFQESVTSLLSSEHPVIIVACTACPQSISHDIRDSFLHHVTMEAPSECERAEMLQGLLLDTKYSSDVDLAYVAQRTAGFVLGDFVALLAHVKKIAIQRIREQCVVSLDEWEEEDLRSAGVIVQHTDFVQALHLLQSAHSDSIGVPKIPNVTWDDVGGLADVKQEILDTIQLPLKHPELLAAGLRRSGIFSPHVLEAKMFSLNITDITVTQEDEIVDLCQFNIPGVMLYGPPGSGKTLLAKAVATECSLNFLSVKGPELINKYVGQSEENVREVFSRARDASPCVIFFDELDSLAPNRGRSGDSGGVMDRVVSQLLAELDGLHKSTDVFVIGATNRPDLLDPALLRPGRFDKPLYLGVSEDKPSQLKILKALTRKFSLGEDVDLETVAEQCPLTLTGADFYALCSDAMLNAVKSKIYQLDQGLEVDQSRVAVSQEDFISALDSLMPSVSEAELERYTQLKSSFTGKG